MEEKLDEVVVVVLQMVEEEEIPVEGKGHNKALHVSVKCMDHVVAKVHIGITKTSRFSR